MGAASSFAPSAGFSGSGGGGGLGLGLDMMGWQKRAMTSFFLVTSLVSSTGVSVFAAAACRPSFSASHASASSHSFFTFAFSSSSMCSYLGSESIEMYDPAVARSADTAGPRLASSAWRSTMGSPLVFSSSSFCTYTPFVSSSPSSYSQSSVWSSTELNAARSSSVTYCSSSAYSLLRMLYTYSSTRFFFSFVSSITRSCRAMSNSRSVASCNAGPAMPANVDATGMSVRTVFFFVLGASAASASMGAAPSSALASPWPSPPALASPSPSPSALGSSALGAASAAGTSSTTSSTTCALSTDTTPCRLRRVLSLILLLPPSFAGGTGPMVKLAICGLMPGGSWDGSL
mmetsp:Transcript_10607/g.36871  ORF Transcript_10607/g.36871 Transcript_10607/m.36871 type:complete len:346 (+) Transcript_10607:181-1218(+)